MKKRSLLLLLALVPALTLGQLTLTGSTFEPSGVSTGGGLELYGIVGQPEAASESQGGSVSLQGGFLSPAQETPLWVDLVVFEVVDQGNGSGPLIRWETAAEIDNIGFDVYRAEFVGTSWLVGERLTSSIIPAKGMSGIGAAYSFNDPLAYYHGSGQRAYFLEDVDVKGKRTLHGPANFSKSATDSSVSEWMILD